MGEGMKRLLILCGVFLLLTACRTSPYPADGSASVGEPQPDHSHPAFSGDNLVEHEPVGYCGNTVTTVRYAPMGKEERECWEQSFWGGDSVTLSDSLRWFDYSGDICRCLPEYYVKTEFSDSEYGISLTQGYVRHEGGQCQLDREQLNTLTQLLEHIADDKTNDLCGYPPAEVKMLY